MTPGVTALANGACVQLASQPLQLGIPRGETADLFGEQQAPNQRRPGRMERVRRLYAMLPEESLTARDEGWGNPLMHTFVAGHFSTVAKEWELLLAHALRGCQLEPRLH